MVLVKKEVRKAKNLKAGQKVTVLINLDLTNYQVVDVGPGVFCAE